MKKSSVACLCIQSLNRNGAVKGSQLTLKPVSIVAVKCNQDQYILSIPVLSSLINLPWLHHQSPHRSDKSKCFVYMRMFSVSDLQWWLVAGPWIQKRDQNSNSSSNASLSSMQLWGPTSKLTQTSQRCWTALFQRINVNAVPYFIRKLAIL